MCSFHASPVALGYDGIPVRSTALNCFVPSLSGRFFLTLNLALQSTTTFFQFASDHARNHRLVLDLIRYPSTIIAALPAPFSTALPWAHRIACHFPLYCCSCVLKSAACFPVLLIQVLPNHCIHGSFPLAKDILHCASRTFVCFCVLRLLCHHFFYSPILELTSS